MTVRHRLRSIALRAGVVALVAGLWVAALLLGAHIPWVQARVGQWATSQLLSRGIELRTTALSYNLATLSVHVEGLVAATTADTAHPFVEAANIDVAFPRSILRGRLAVSFLSADGVRVIVLRRPDGSMNLPESPRDATSSSAPFPIGAVTLQNASVIWRDEMLGMSAEAERLSLSLGSTERGLSGTVTLGQPATFRAGGRTTAIAADARIAWNGSTLAIDALRLSAPEVTLDATGSIALLAAGLPMTIDANGSADLNRLVAWFATGEQPVGRLTFRARATGSAAEPRAEVTLSSQNLAWQGLSNVSADVSARFDRAALEIGPANVRLLGGTAAGSGRISLASVPLGAERARATIDWRGVDAAAVLRTIRVKAPVAVSTRLDGRATASWTAWTIEGLTASLTAATQSAPGDARALALNGSVTLGTRAGTWQGTIDQWLDRAVHLEGSADGQLSSASLAASTIAASLVATADSWPDVWSRLHELDLVAVSAPAGATGSGRAEITLSGRIDNPRLAGQLDATLPDLHELRFTDPPNLQLSGRLGLSAVVSGTARAPAIDGRLVGEALSLAGQHADRLDASFGLAADTLRIESLALTQADGTLTGNGRYDLRTGEVMALLTASRLTVSPVPGSRPDEILVPISARLSGEWQVSGTTAAPQGSGRLDLDEAKVLERDVGRVTARLALADRRLNATIDLVDLFTTGTAALGLASPGVFTVETQTKDAELATLASRLRLATGAPVQGVASFTSHIEGDRQDLARVRATVDLQRLDGVVGDVPVRLMRPGRASYDARTVDVADLSLNIGRSELRAMGRLGPDPPGTLTASLDGEVGDLEQLAAAFSTAGPSGSRVKVDGRVHVDMAARGSLERPALNAVASLDGGQVAIAGQPQAASLVVRASYDAGVLTLSRLDAMWQDATASATGEIPIALVSPNVPVWLTGTPGSPPAPGRLRARIDSITPAVLAPFVPAETLSRLSGLISGTLTLDADRPLLSSVHGQLILDRVDLTVAGVPFQQQKPTQVDVANGHARIVEWDWGGVGNRLSLTGGFQFDDHPTLDIAADGTIDLRVLGAFLPGATTGGRGLLKARASGAWDNPQLDGRIELEAVEWRNASPRLAISDLTGSLVLSRDELTVADVSGNANGGFISIAGTLKHAGLRLESGKLAISGQGLAMAIPEALKTEVNLELTLTVDRGALSLTGDAVVLGGSYREPISLASGLLQELVSPPASVQLDTPSAANAIELDIRLTTGDDIVVDNNYAQLGLAADVRIGGTVAAPTLLGRAEARDGGRIFLGGNVYQIDGAGVIDFSNPSRIEPDLRITAVARVAGYSVRLNLNGTPATLETTLTSEPPLSQGEIVSLLATGQKDSAMAIGSDQVIGYLSGEVLGVTGRALGLDALRIERGQDVRFDAGLVAGETDPSSRLTFGKQVTRTVEVVFSQSLKDSGKLTWIIGYRARPSIELRFVSQDNESLIYDFRHDVTIGDVKTAPPVARPVVRIASVRFTGVPGVPENALRDRLRLTEKKVFDFFRWQQDRDRLEAELRQDGHFEARVSARRSGLQETAGVDLTYDVDRGPRTIIDISGVPDERTLRRELERLWSQAVLDGFLVEEARSAVRAAMVRDGYVRATETIAIDRKNGANEKHLVVSVEPGPRFSSPRLLFTGQQHVGAARLEEVAGQNASPWVDPTPLVKAITTMYRNEGFLESAVTVGAPRFDGAEATLPITISEGPLFRLQSVAFVGARARTVDAARKAFGLQPGVALTRAAEDNAVQALASAYRADGFNTVRVTLTNQATRGTGLVALTVNIDEGPRQVLRAISTEGVRRTNPELVSRELKLDIGRPVDRLAWAQARKRLYDTSVFRQVDIQAVPIEPSVPVEQAVPTDQSVPPDKSRAADEPRADNTVAVEQPVQARVTVGEWPPLRIRYGFELADQEEPVSEKRELRPGVAADATYRNIFGRAATTGLALRYTKDFEAARAFFSKPSFFGLPLTSNLFLARSREQFGASTDRPFITDVSEFTAEQRFRVGRRLQLAYSYNFQRNHTFDTNASPDDPLAFDVTLNIARLTATTLIDTRDDLVDATRGMLLSSTFEYGAGPLGSDLRFAKDFFQQNYYRTIGHGLVFATSGRLGVGAGYGQELIPSERFRAGGGNSVRGFTEDSLGPVDVFGDPTGGNALVVFNEELRFPIAGRFRGVGFFDAGNTFATIEEFSLGRLRMGAGGGLRVKTPFALLRVDLGTPLGPKPGEPRMRWFFSIGQAF